MDPLSKAQVLSADKVKEISTIENLTAFSEIKEENCQTTFGKENSAFQDAPNTSHVNEEIEHITCEKENSIHAGIIMPFYKQLVIILTLIMSIILKSFKNEKKFQISFLLKNLKKVVF